MSKKKTKPIKKILSKKRPTKKASLFYNFNQNNSGGRFVRTKFLDMNVIIEAYSEKDAIHRGEEFGIYFYGVREGRDCGCCGDRWYKPEKGTRNPSIYGQPVKEHIEDDRFADHKSATIHYLDGRIIRISHPKCEERYKENEE